MVTVASHRHNARAKSAIGQTRFHGKCQPPRIQPKPELSSRETRRGDGTASSTAVGCSGLKGSPNYSGMTATSTVSQSSG
jgi:hypothetical protein